jgi:hypothetical protein
MSNPYEEEKEEKQALVEIESSRAIAEVQGQVVMAKKFPRDPVVAMDRILNECRRETLAEQAQYQFPRGGTMVTGPSIRLAETIARNWGNLSFGVTEVERKGQESQMLAYAWDLETNVMARQEFKVRHLRDTKEGLRPLRDERDVYEITANQAARRLRSCILRIIPGDVVDGALEECSKTLAAKVGNVQERIPGMLEKFKELGISKLQIEKRLRHRIESLNGPELLSLIKIYNSVKDGMSSVDDYFEAEQKEQPAKEDPAQVAAAMVEKIKARVKKQEPTPDAAIESKSYQEAEVKMSELPDDELPIF